MNLYSFDVAQSKVHFAREKPVEHSKHPGISGRFHPCKQTQNPIDVDIDIDNIIGRTIVAKKTRKNVYITHSNFLVRMDHTQAIIAVKLFGIISEIRGVQN